MSVVIECRYCGCRGSGTDVACGDCGRTGTMRHRCTAHGELGGSHCSECAAGSHAAASVPPAADPRRGRPTAIRRSPGSGPTLDPVGTGGRRVPDSPDPSPPLSGPGSTSTGTGGPGGGALPDPPAPGRWLGRLVKIGLVVGGVAWFGDAFGIWDHVPSPRPVDPAIEFVIDMGDPVEVKRGIRAYRNGDLPAAETHFDYAVGLHPGHARALAYLARLHSENQRFASADSLFARAVADDADDPTVLRHRGMNGLLWHLAIQRGEADAAMVDSTFPPLAIAEISLLMALGHYDPTDLDDLQREVVGAYICARTLAGRPEATPEMVERAGVGWWEACIDV